jgi:hypothetical protein
MKTKTKKYSIINKIKLILCFIKHKNKIGDLLFTIYDFHHQLHYLHDSEMRPLLVALKNKKLIASYHLACWFVGLFSNYHELKQLH